MTPIEASLKKNQKLVFSNLQNKRKEHEPKLKLGQLVRTADIRRLFSKVDSAKWSFSYTQLPKSHTKQFLHIEVINYKVQRKPIEFHETNS